MTQQTINIGTTANDGTGDPARTAFGKVNDNFDELYAVGSVAPAATGVAATDTDALQAWIAAAGEGATLHLQDGTYLIDQSLVLLSGQKLIGHGSVLKRCDQISTTTDTNVTSGVTDTITLASAVGLRVGSEIVLQTGASTNYDTHSRVITGISGNDVTISDQFGITSTNQFAVHLAFCTVEATDNNQISGIEFDGNKANWTFAKWQHTMEVSPGNASSRCLVSDNWFHDLPGEGIVEGGQVATTCDSAANNVAAGGTTIVVASTADLAVGKYIAITKDGTDWEPYAHCITDITGTTVTIDSPGWWFASTSGTVDVYVYMTDCRYEKNLFERVNGNAIHFSGSSGTQVVNNQFKYCNLDTDVEHGYGAICWSAICVNVQCVNNRISDDAVGAFGAVGRIDSSGAHLSGNVIDRCVTNTITMNADSSTGYGPRNVVFSHNIVRNSGSVYVSNAASTSTESNYIVDTSIVGNVFYKTPLYLRRTRGTVVSGNRFNYEGDTTTTIITGLIGNIGCSFTGNTFYGGAKAFDMGGTNPDLTITGNACRSQYTTGIYVAGNTTGNVIANNSVSSDASSDPWNYQGIAIGTGTGVLVTGNNVALTSGYAAIRLQGNGGTIVDNVMSNAGYNFGAGKYEFRIETGLSGYVVRNNKTANAVSDVPGLSPIPNEQLLFVKRAADLQSTADQALTQWESEQITRYMVTRVTAICKTGGATVACAGGLYTAASKGGTALVAAAQSWINLSAANKIVQATLEAVNGTDSQSAAPLYFSLTTGSTAAATADIFVYGTVLD